MTKARKPGMKVGHEVARLTVKVSPDTSGFYNELKRKLQAIDKMLKSRGEVPLRGDTDQLEKDVDKGTKKATEKAAKRHRVKVKPSVDTSNMDRFSRRTLGELEREMARAERRIQLTGAGEDLRRNLERAHKVVSDMIRKGPPLGDKKDIVKWRKNVVDEIQTLREIADGNEGVKSNPLGLTDRRYRALQRLTRIRNIIEEDRASTRAAQLRQLNADVAALERDQERRGADLASRLTREHKEQVASHKARLKLIEDWLKAEEEWKDRRRQEILNDPFNRRAIADLRRAAQRIEAKIPATVDGERLRSELHATVKRLEREIEADIPVDVHIRADKRRQLRREIDALLAGAEFENNEGGRRRNIFSNLGKQTGKWMPNFGTGINLSGYLVIFGLIMNLLSPLLGLVTSALMTLPGLIASVATPIGAIYLGLDGIREAAKVLEQPFANLKAKMSEVARVQFTPVFERLIPIMDRLQDSLPSVTTGLARMADGLIDALYADGGVQVDRIVTNIGDALAASAPGIRDFTSGLMTLTEEFTKQLPGLTEWFNSTGSDFKNWIDEMSKNGELDRAFDGLGNTIKSLLDFAGELALEGMEFITDPDAVRGFLDELRMVMDVLKNIAEMSTEFVASMDDIMAFFGHDEAGKRNAIRENPDVKPLIDQAVKEGKRWDAYLGTGESTLPWWMDPEGWANDIKKWITGDNSPQAVADGINKIGEAAENAKKPVTEFFGGSGEFGSLTAPGQSIFGSAVGGDGGAEKADSLFGAMLPKKEQVEAKAAEYQQFISTITSQVQGALQQSMTGDTLPAPDFSEFKAAWEELPPLVEEKGQEILNACQRLVQGITTSLSGLGGVGSSAGTALMQGLLSGMQSMEGPVLAYAGTLADKIAQEKGPLDYDRKVLIPNGEALMHGLSVGLENGFQPVLEQARAMAEQIAIAFEEGADPTQILKSINPEDLKRIEAALEYEDKKADARVRALNNRAKITEDKALKESLRKQASEIQMGNEKIEGYRDLIDLVKEFNDEYDNADPSGDPLVQAASRLMNTPIDFAKATGKQFLSDLGVSGDGLIGRALTEGIQYIFQIGTVDEALSIKDRTDSRRARGFGIGR
ncbi:hypothetical protein AU152_gp21 [Mycobacterium phage Phlei]|uniref:Tape measure protein n=1 Tax=Mycobacterium phage Phlei TaxID=1690684 RepID=A0A0N9BDM5_9CAUD|nr:hypothetical protein AU152_gp21 [Mycobacterium phage Phlei]ALA48134.1 hypothetical protein [Mycobacterium phage Phlei]